VAAGSLDRHNLGYLLAKASQRWNELLYERFRQAGFADVRPAYGSILIPLYEQDGLRIGELGRRARLSKQTMTTLVRLTERNGLVQRRADPGDRRAARIYLTDRGHAFRPVAEAVLADLDALVREALPAADRRTLTRALELLMDLKDPESQSPPNRQGRA
jgi:DNA-binding MarR family transcriptional regulator